MSDPTKFFFQASQALFGVLPDDEFGIKEVKVVTDTDTILYLVLLAKHETISTTNAFNKKTAMRKNKNGMLLYRARTKETCGADITLARYIPK